MTPREVRSLSVPEYLALASKKRQVQKEQERQANKARSRRKR